MKLLVSTALVCLGLFKVTASAQNLLTNGSFETGVTNDINSFYAGATNLTGWTISGPRSLYWVSPGEFNPVAAVHGIRYVDFNGAGGGITLSQAFATTPGEVYEVKFSVGLWQGTNCCRLESVTAQVASSNGAILATAVAPMPNTRGWAGPTVFRFVASTASTTLSLTDTNATVNYDLMLDAVSVERVTPRLTIECSQVRVCWDSATNAQYQLQFFTNGAWVDLGAPVAGTGGRDCTNQPMTEPQRLFRVVRLP